MFGKIEDLSHSFPGRTTVMWWANVSRRAGNNVLSVELAN
jgi:hypothetical protein